MRKTYTTTIEQELQKKFKLKCIENDVKMNDVLEAFFLAFHDEKIFLHNGKFRVTKPKK